MSSPPPNTPPPSKKEVMLALLERAEARVHLDARRAGVRLPGALPRAEAHLRLDYGYRLSPPIPDLTIDDDGHHARRCRSTGCRSAPSCRGSAVYLIADFDGNGAVWQEDIPADLKMEQPPTASAPQPPAQPAETPPEPKKPRPSHLKLVK